MSILALWFSFVIATIPGECQETALAALDRPRWRIAYVEDGEEKTKLGSTRDPLFAGEVDKATRRRNSLFSNNLVLPGFNLFETLKIDEPKKLVWKERLIDLRGRHLEQAVLDGADLTKADLYGAQLQGASFWRAHLQDASLEGAQLQGAELVAAHLQGASFASARLHSASLVGAHLQGAFLYLAELQGASLGGAHLQGASLEGAQLQGASLNLARLQGASLIEANLQGASLEGAQLQGASLDGAAVNAANFSDAFLWRTDWGEIDPAKLGAVRLDAASARWKPVWQKDFDSSLIPWDAKAYAELRLSMNSIPEGKMRQAALKRIETLDCEDKNLASCDPDATPPPEVLDWQKKLSTASVEDAVYEKALATELRDLICENDANALDNLRAIVRGIIETGRLDDTGREVPALVDFIMSKDCPVSAWLTAEDKAKLLEIKQEAERKSAPPPAPKKDK